MVGQTLSHYHIVEKLGEGGMGVVFRAVDTKLNRPVAIKILPPDLSADTARTSRFLHEARSASALNHPNIITVHDVDTVDGVTFIAMEYVDGTALDHMIGSKGIKLGEALTYAVQIADALAAAHAAGIVHRDLKPGNVMVTTRGRVKVLDFGLAKTIAGGDADDATLTRTSNAGVGPLTEEGTILGTVAYMSPEQAEGKRVDARSDIFAFGALLYEMVTGRRAFRAETKIATLSAILSKEPTPASETVRGVPRELDRIITHCLRKDPSRRFQHLDDVKTLLEELKEHSASGSVVSPSRSTGRLRRMRAVPAAATIAGIAIGAVILGWLARGRAPRPTQVSAPTRLTFDSGLTTDAALSSDGKLVAYASDRAGADNLDIWVQNIVGGAATRLTSDDADEREPSFSPDGSRIAFRSENAGGGIYVIPSLGGDARLVAQGGRRPMFSPDGVWIAYFIGIGDVNTSVSGELYIVASTGGVPKPIHVREVDRASHPVWTPDGKHLLFLGLSSKAERQEYSDWWVTPIDGGRAIATGAFATFRRRELKTFGDDVAIPAPGRWVDDGVVFLGQAGNSKNVWHVRLSPDTWQVAGDAERLTYGTSLEAQPSIASIFEGGQGRGSRLVFASLTSTINTWSVPIDPNTGKVGGAPQRLTSSAYDGQGSLSDNGRRLAFASNRSGNLDIWLKDLESGKETALTTGPADEFGPEISADGSKVFYQTIEGNAASWRFDVVGVGPGGQAGVAQKVCAGCVRLWDPSFDGRYLLFIINDDPPTVGLLEVAGGRKVELLHKPTQALVRARFSPDDRWLSFVAVSNQGRSRVYVAPFRGTPAPQPTPEAEWVAVTDEGSYDKAVWSPDGNLLYFTSDQDGYRCVWARRLDSTTKRPVGEPFAVWHSHIARRSLANADILKLELAVAPGKLVFQLGEITGNIWMATLQ